MPESQHRRAPHRDRDRWTILERAKEFAVACRDGTQSHSSVACSRPHAHSVVCEINFNFVHHRREGDHERRHGPWWTEFVRGGQASHPRAPSFWARTRLFPTPDSKLRFAGGVGSLQYVAGSPD